MAHIRGETMASRYFFANSASTYFLATPLGKNMSSSGAIAGEKVDPTVDATPIDIKYEDIPEETHMQFEVVFQKEQGCQE